MKKTHCKRGHERSPENVYEGRACKECNKARTAKYCLEHPEKAKAYTAKYRLEHPEYTMLTRTRQRAKKQNVPCTITEGDIYIPDNCPVFGFPLVRKIGSFGGAFNSPSLDKIIPSLGYVPGNIQVISNLANKMKNDATSEQLILFAQWILRQKTTQDVQYTKEH